MQARTESWSIIEEETARGNPFRFTCMTAPDAGENRVLVDHKRGDSWWQPIQSYAYNCKKMQARIESWLTIEEETAETCRQTLEGDIEFKILGLGHVVEKIVVENLKSIYKGVPKIVDR
jgi:hypothetical protein